MLRAKVAESADVMKKIQSKTIISREIIWFMGYFLSTMKTSVSGDEISLTISSRLQFSADLIAIKPNTENQTIVIKIGIKKRQQSKILATKFLMFGVFCMAQPIIRFILYKI